MKPASSKGDATHFVPMVPNVCNTPTPGGPGPIPYPNIGRTKKPTAGKTVVVKQQPVVHSDSQVSTTSGDEPGTQKQIISNKMQGKVYYSAWSMDVKVQGENVGLLQPGGAGREKDFGYDESTDSLTTTEIPEGVRVHQSRREADVVKSNVAASKGWQWRGSHPAPFNRALQSHAELKRSR